MLAARERFARDGYAATSLDAVAHDAGVTKGSLYHHFRGKLELFEAVFAAEAQSYSQRVAEAAFKGGDPWEVARIGISEALRISQERSTLRICITDGAGALGWERAREIEASAGLGNVKAVLALLQEAGEIADHDLDALAHLFMALLAEGAHLLARSEDPDEARRRVEREILALLEGLRAS